MFIKVAASKAVTVIKVMSAVLICTGAVFFSAACTQGARDGIGFCLKVLVPSLFPFMAVSSFLVNSGIADTMGRPLDKITRAVFGLGHSFASVILLSLIGGYPIGAKTIAGLYKNKTADKAECEKAAMFAVCAGPGFLVNFVGMSLYGSKKTGIILLVSQMLSVVIIGIFIRFFYRNKSDDKCDKAVNFKPMPLSNAVVQSAVDSSKGMFVICAFVVLFSAFTGLLGEVVPSSDTKDCLLILLEVCSAVSKLAARKPIELIAFATGFGGLCVHFQIFSSLGELKINKLLFFCIRIIQGIITAVLTHLGLILFCSEQQVFSTATAKGAEIYGGTVISAIALLGTEICFLYSIKNCKQN